MVSVGGGIIIAIVVFIVVGAIGWVLFTQLRARNLGLPTPSLSDYLPWKRSSSAYGAPSPASGGVVGWVKDQVAKLRGGSSNNRSARGAYEQSGAASGRRGFGPLDPDEAWDTRVGTEADDYEYYERRTGGAGASGSGAGAGAGADRDSLEYAGAGAYDSINLSGPYGDEEQRGRRQDRRNPFDDDAADASLRGMSPRPMDGDKRSSAFKEQV